ncbi:Sugar or nucleoside kinase, ribokinase family [Tranquillimonas rosea]|uniref:Sugar or nucleoside kinase, ribokinase family n=1 Tax=Tranquillimonas rosea TaxID=641238 RepID=A0A1H9PAC3_9RHOB|nr:PfkB family carbohydrate kinase [Tranquillimonas rosea]SER44845.1 Sugar or nucleoside kinase, ribokinase family [Tranquillimonas rosea]
MSVTPDILCIGSVLWDVIGRSGAHMRVGSDVPGRIVRQPGGVAMNIALALRRFGLVPELLSAVGRDVEGDALLAAARELGIGTAHLYRSDDLPTDSYMAVEGANGLIAAIADAHSLEQAGEKILAPLSDGRLGTVETPWTGPIALDGNLTEGLLARIAGLPAFASADLKIAPASPGKAERLVPLLGHPTATFYVNREEAGLIVGRPVDDAAEAAAALVARGAHRALVTDGAAPAAEDGVNGPRKATPPEVLVTRVTGAGDSFMAAHIAAEQDGAAPDDALNAALRAAALHVSGDVSP